MRYLLQHLLRRPVAEHPQSTAFKFLKQSLSYEALDRQSTQLAIQLSSLGVARGDRVGILLNKSIECPIAVFGILKSGGVYVPLDPGAPLGRLAAIVRDCDISVLVTHEPRRDDVISLLQSPDSPVSTVIGPSSTLIEGVAQVSWPAVFEGSLAPEPEAAGATADNAAYIIYTSGSTGAPKGIVHSHGSGLSYALMAAELYDLGPDDRLSNFPPLHFDQSVFDYFSGVAAGACTVIIPEAYTKLPASLSELIQRERLTLWYSVPHALIQLLLHGVLASRDLGSLRWVLYGGEPFPPKHLSRLMNALPQARFCNVYGPAEVNQCTFHTLTDEDLKNLQSVPIGRACPNVELLVVDPEGRFVDRGESGELLVRSPTMMRGYFGKPDLNEAVLYRRINDDSTIDNFYRTGDIVLRDDAGLLHFLSRSDRQVKLRGFRIELDEIEAVMTRHVAVEESACILCQDAKRDQLHLLITLKPGLDCDPAHLRAYAGEHLPGYAVPECIDIVTEFPRTSTGKIDRTRIKLERDEPGLAGSVS